MGLALDPEFEEEPFVYPSSFHTTAEGLQLERWGASARTNAMTFEESPHPRGVIEAGPIHDSGRIAFGHRRATSTSPPATRATA